MDKKIVLQDGVTFSYDNDGVVRDMSILDGVEEVELYMDVAMEDTRKCFPDVKKLIVGSGVSMIDIPNSLFPNVRSVESMSTCFQSGPYLVRKFDLKNTFYRDENDVIDLKNVYTISAYAFNGCKSLKIKNTDALSSCMSYMSINKNIFAGSGLMAQPFVNGVKMAGNIVIAIDETADEVVIPDKNRNRIIFLYGIPLHKIKKMVVHNEYTLSCICYESGLPQNVVFKTNEYVIPGDIVDLAHKSSGASYVHHFSIESPDYKEVDGIIYTSDMQSLVSCSIDADDVTIPEGVTLIACHAFFKSHLKSVRLPDSLSDIQKGAFEDCKMLEKVDFGKGLTDIGIDVFRGCKSLKSVVLPPQIKLIKQNAFMNSGLESIVLNNGLEGINTCAFSGTDIKRLCLPESIKNVETWFVNDTIESVSSPIFHKSIVSSISVQGYYSKVTDSYVKLEISGKYAYLPKCIKPGMYREMQSRVEAFFTDPTTEFCTFWDCAYSAKGKENLAFWEYKEFNDAYAKAYIKKNSKRFIKRLLDEGDEERAVDFLKTGFVSKVTLKTLLPIAKEKEQTTVQSYILEQMNSKGIAKENLYL